MLNSTGIVYHCSCMVVQLTGPDDHQKVLMGYSGRCGHRSRYVVVPTGHLGRGWPIRLDYKWSLRDHRNDLMDHQGPLVDSDGFFNRDVLTGLPQVWT